jgi:hypothetical protein
VFLPFGVAAAGSARASAVWAAYGVITTVAKSITRTPANGPGLVISGID